MKSKDELALEKYGWIYSIRDLKYNDLCNSRRRIIDILYESQGG